MVWTRTWRLAVACWGSSRTAPASRLVPADGPEQWTAGTLFPQSSKKVARDQRRQRATGRWWCWRTSPASTARRSRCASGSSSTAPRSAARWSTSGTDRLLRDLALPRRRVRGLLAAPQRDLEAVAARGRHASVIGGAGRRVVFAREVKRRTRATRGSWSSTSASTRRRAPERGDCAPSGPSSGAGCTPRSWESWRRSSTRSTASSARSRSARSADHPAGRAAPLPDRGDRARDAAHARRRGRTNGPAGVADARAR